jgi:hypothetical protein
VNTRTFGTTSTRSHRTSLTGTQTRTQVTDEPRGRWVSVGLRARELFQGTVEAGARWWAVWRALVTPAGWLVIVWVVVGAVIGLRWGWDEFLVSALVGLALLVLATPFLLGRSAYDVDFALDRDNVVAGSDVAGDIVVRNSSSRVALPSRIDIPVGDGLVEFPVPMLRSGQEHRERLVIPGARRGIIDVGPATTTRTDPLRLLQRRFHWADVKTLYVHPKTVSVPSTSLGFIRDLEGRAARILTSDDIAFASIREYAMGDAQRHIHWKSTAKLGQLMVRQFEQTKRSLITLVLDRDPESYANDEEFEMAVSSVGSLGVRALRDGREVQAVMSGEVPEFARASVRSLVMMRVTSPRTLLDDLSGVDKNVAVMDLPTVARMVGDAKAGTSLAFLVTGSLCPLKSLQSAAMRLPRETSVAAVVCDTESEPGTHAAAGVHVMSLGILDDLRQLMAKGLTR